MKRLGKVIIVLSAMAALALFATGCTKDVNATFDTTTCIYDHNTQRLIKQVLPGANRESVDKADDTVEIPTSNRFFRASSILTPNDNGGYTVSDDGKKDPGASDYYIAYAQGHVPVRVEGQIHFRFKVDSACGWYAAHGRRNEPLDFNARGGNQGNTGWARWLGENFDGTMAQVVKDSSGGYQWQSLVYGNDTTTNSQSGNKTGNTDPVSISYGKHLGEQFTARLPQNIGGTYFCGTDKTVGGDASCPTMYFEVTRIVTDDPRLMESQSAVAQAQQDASTADKLAETHRSTNAKLIDAEKLKQNLLEKQIETARLTALSTETVQKCLIFAKVNLDCDGHFRNSGNITVNGK